MARKNLPSDAEKTTRQRRVCQLADLIFRGNQREAARRTGISQAQISRVINGARAATDDFLNAFARLPGVNPDWLLCGVGEPLLPPTVGTLPISHVILPGLPLDYSHLLTAARHPVAAAFDQRTRYWLRLGSGSGLVRALKQFMPDDLLLVETDRLVLSRLDAVVDRLCAVTVRVDSQAYYSLARVLVSSGALLARLYDVPIVLTMPIKQAADQGAPGAGIGQQSVRRRRTITKLDKPSGKETAAPNTSEQAAVFQPVGPTASGPIGQGSLWRLAGLDDVVGIVVKLERIAFALIPVTQAVPAAQRGVVREKDVVAQQDLAKHQVIQERF